MELKKIRVERNLTQREVCERVGVKNTPLLSNMENGLCNPTPAQFMAMCGLYECEPRALARPEEVRYCINRTGDRHKLGGRIQHRLSPERLEAVKEAVQMCGYGTVQAWLETCVYRLLTEANKKRPRDPEHHTSASEI